MPDDADMTPLGREIVSALKELESTLAAHPLPAACPACAARWLSVSVVSGTAACGACGHSWSYTAPEENP